MYCNKCAKSIIKARLCPRHFNSLNNNDQKYFVKLNKIIGRILLFIFLSGLLSYLFILTFFLYQINFFILILLAWMFVGFFIGILFYLDHFYKKKIRSRFNVKFY
jgi:hypothetical protein